MTETLVIDRRPESVQRATQAKRLGDTIKVMFMLQDGATVQRIAKTIERCPRTVHRYLKAIQASGADYTCEDGVYKLNKPLAETFKAT